MPVSQMADILGVKRYTFDLWAKTGRIPAFHVERRWMCIPEAVVAEVTKPLGSYAQTSSTSIVFRQLRTRLLGSRPQVHMPITPNTRHRSPPGVTSVAASERPQSRASSQLGPDDEVRQVVNMTMLADLLMCKRATISRMVREGEVPHFEIDGQLRFEVARVLDFLHEHASAASLVWSQPARSAAGHKAAETRRRNARSHTSKFEARA